jgi:hypothetical protein
MTSSFTTTATFTRTHAKHLASKVIADLYQCATLYGHPDIAGIGDYETELIEMLSYEYVATYEFGFKKDGERVVSWHYSVGADGGLHGDSNAGALYTKADISGASYFNFMVYSDKWGKLPETQQKQFKSQLPFDRAPGSAPVDGNGYWQVDHGYSAGGVRVERKTYRQR